MATVSLRIDQSLVTQAEREARIQNRSKIKQLEYWAKLGRIISSKLNVADVFAVSQGIKTISLEITQQPAYSIDSDDIFNDLEKDRNNGVLAENVTSSDIYFEASVEHPGYLECVNNLTKKRQTGTFENGEFKAL
jgi:hypothetical protein